MGERIDLNDPNAQDTIVELLNYYRQKNKILGYGGIDWNKDTYIEIINKLNSKDFEINP